MPYRTNSFLQFSEYSFYSMRTCTPIGSSAISKIRVFIFYFLTRAYQYTLKNITIIIGVCTVIIYKCVNTLNYQYFFVQYHLCRSVSIETIEFKQLRTSACRLL